MATIDSLEVLLKATTSNFDRAMKRSEATLSKFEKGVGLAKKALIAFGSAFAIRGLANSLKATANEIDEIAKSADRLGISTESLSAFRHGAALAGITAEQFTTSLERMSKNIGLAALGSGEATQALEAMGLSLENLGRMGTEQQLRAIANGLQNTTNASERLAIATRIFGREGMGIVNVLQDGAAGLDAMRREAERLGIVFDRQVAAEVERANDAMTTLGASVEGLKRQLAIALAPALADAADKLTEVATRFRTTFGGSDVAGERGSAQSRLEGRRGASQSELRARFKASMAASAQAQRELETLAGSSGRRSLIELAVAKGSEVFGAEDPFSKRERDLLGLLGTLKHEQEALIAAMKERREVEDTLASNAANFASRQRGFQPALAAGIATAMGVRPGGHRVLSPEEKQLNAGLQQAVGLGMAIVGGARVGGKIADSGSGSNIMELAELFTRRQEQLRAAEGATIGAADITSREAFSTIARSANLRGGTGSVEDNTRVSAETLRRMEPLLRKMADQTQIVVEF